MFLVVHFLVFARKTPACAQHFWSTFGGISKGSRINPSHTRGQTVHVFKVNAKEGFLIVKNHGRWIRTLRTELTMHDMDCHGSWELAWNHGACTFDLGISNSWMIHATDRALNRRK